MVMVSIFLILIVYIQSVRWYVCETMHVLELIFMNEM